MVPEPPHDPGPDALDALAHKLMRDLEQESPAPPEPSSGLDWIRHTLRAGGAETDNLIGTLFQDKYRILRRIGKGGFGAVYEAVDERGARNRVALKIQLPGFVPSPERRETFRKEAMRVTRLNHPNIVDWKSFDETPDGGSYFVMELLDGVELSEALRAEGAFEAERAQRLLIQILGALSAAHFVARGLSILHLDLKPKNILLLAETDTRLEKIKVIDFGIGQFLGDEAPAPVSRDPSAAPPVPAERPTLRGTITAVAGGTSAAVALRAAHYPFEISQAYTAEYASPEHCVHIEFSSGQDCEPEALDGRSDLYSFGVLAYELLTGRLPYASPVHRPGWLRIHQEAPIQPWGKDEARIPAALRRFVERCLEKDRDERFADTRAALEELERIARPSVVKRLVLAAVGLVLAGIAIAQMLPPTRGHMTVLEGGEEFSVHHHGPHSEPWIVELFEADRGRAMDEDTALRLTSNGAGELAQWSITPGEQAGHFILGPPGGFSKLHPERQPFPQVRVEDESGAWRSDPFTLVWLGEHSARTQLFIAGSPITPAQSVVAVDPGGLTLRLQFPGLQGTNLERADWSLAQDGQSLALGPITDSPSGAQLSASLEGLSSGRTELLLEGQDRAGTAYHFLIPLEVDPSPLEVRLELRLQDGAGAAHWSPGQRRSFFPGEALELVLQPSRPCSVICEELDFEGLATVGDDEAPLLALPLAAWLAGRPTSVDLELELQVVDHLLHDASTAAKRHRLSLRLPLRVLEAPEIRWSWKAQPASDEFGPRPPNLFITDGRGTLELFADTRLARERFEVELTLDEVGLLREAGAASSVSLSADERVLDIASLLPRGEKPLSEGEHSLDVATYKLDPQGQRQTLSPLSMAEMRVLIDRSAPQLAAPRAASERVRGLTEEWQVEYDYPLDPGSPIAIRWQVFAQGEREPLFGDVTLASVMEGGRKVLNVRPLDGERSARKLSDGHYAIELEAFDRAGNRQALGRLGVEFAHSAPQLKVLKPEQEVGSDIAEWLPTAGRLQSIVIEASDPNGVASVECSVYRKAPDGLQSGQRHFPATALEESLGETEGLWSWSFDPPPAWSFAADVWILLKATDQAGQAQIMPYGPLRLPRIRASYPAQLGGQWLIPGNQKAPYSFKGRASVEENRCFTRAGLSPIWVAPGREKPGEAESAWNLPLAQGQLEPYYLAESEVSTGEFLSFLLDLKQGYMNREWWPSPALPTDQRRRELLALFETRDPARTATDLWHCEASAYARAQDRRLPTLLELTFAIRGGPELYRARSWDSQPAARANPENPWQRVRGLSSGAEWTRSPVSLERRGEGSRVPTDVAAFLPGTRGAAGGAGPYWISGTPAGLLGIDGKLLRSDFAAVDRGDASAWSDSRVGFRLAISADRALEQERGEVQVLELQRPAAQNPNPQNPAREDEQEP